MQREAKTKIVDTMIFNKPYSFVACYYTDSFELISAFEFKTSANVMWSEPIKDLIIDECRKESTSSLRRLKNDEDFKLFHAYEKNILMVRELS